jgi:hypothetical protein
MSEMERNQSLRSLVAQTVHSVMLTGIDTLSKSIPPSQSATHYMLLNQQQPVEQQELQQPVEQQEQQEQQQQQRREQQKQRRREQKRQRRQEQRREQQKQQLSDKDLIVAFKALTHIDGISTNDCNYQTSVNKLSNSVMFSSIGNPMMEYLSGSCWYLIQDEYLITFRCSGKVNQGGLYLRFEVLQNDGDLWCIDINNNNTLIPNPTLLDKAKILPTLPYTDSKRVIRGFLWVQDPSNPSLLIHGFWLYCDPNLIKNSHNATRRMLPVKADTRLPIGLKQQSFPFHLLKSSKEPLFVL